MLILSYDYTCAGVLVNINIGSDVKINLNKKQDADRSQNVAHWFAHLENEKNSVIH